MTKRTIFSSFLILIVGLSACGNNVVQLSSLESGNSIAAPVVSSEPLQEDNLTNREGNDDLSPISYRESASFAALFESNPIDRYFEEKDESLVPFTTIEIAQFLNIYASAWGAEMDNAYELLKNLTNNEHVRDLLDNERRSYLEHMANQIELSILFQFSNAFHGDDEYLFFGTMRFIYRAAAQKDGYRAKARELLNELYLRGITPQFVFLEEKYDELLQEAFPYRWDEVYGIRS